MRIYELAKEIGVPSSEVVEFLTQNDVEVKNHMTVLEDDVIEMVRANYITRSEAVEENTPERVVPKKKIKTDADYRPDEMIPCRSVFPGVLIFNGSHTGMVYKFNGAGDRRNIEYQDLKAGMLQQKSSMYNPDFIIEDTELIEDEHWRDIKEVYDSMYDTKDIEKIMSLPTRDFKTAFEQLPNVARQTIITKIATQIDNGTFEQYNKAKAIDDICGINLTLKMM